MFVWVLLESWVKLNAIEKHDGKASLLFTITDTGIGVMEKDQEIIFEAFQQADMSTTRKFEGTGLRLTISNNFLQKMGSKLKFKSTYSKGSEFWFELLLPCEQAENAESIIQDAEKKAKAQTSEKKKVLIAEDNPVNMNYAITALTKLSKDIQIMTAKDGLVPLTLPLEFFSSLLLSCILCLVFGLNKANRKSYQCCYNSAN